MLKKYKYIKEYLIQFLKEETFKTGLNGGVVGLSGGIDSAVVAVLAKEAFGNRLLCVLMPSESSDPRSINDAEALCQKFDIRYELEPLSDLIKSYRALDHADKLRTSNFAARMRMAILYDISARERALVLGTSNKSELLLGYGTIYGDLACAINPIGDLYKSEIFEFAAFLGVNDAVLTKKPSADLWEGQRDEDGLEYPYAAMDGALKEFVENRLSRDELIEKGYDIEMIDLIISRIYQNQFKRKLPIIAKLTSRAIGHDFLYPRDIKL